MPTNRSNSLSSALLHPPFLRHFKRKKVEGNSNGFFFQIRRKGGAKIGQLSSVKLIFKEPKKETTPF